MTPQEQQNSLRKLYEAGTSIFDLGDYDTFQEKMSAAGSRRKFYDALSKHYDLGEFAEFEGKVLGLLPSQQYDDSWSGAAKRGYQMLFSAASKAPSVVSHTIGGLGRPIAGALEAIGVPTITQEGITRSEEKWDELLAPIEKKVAGIPERRFGEIKPASPKKTGFEGISLSKPRESLENIGKTMLEQGPLVALLGASFLLNPRLGSAMMYLAESSDTLQGMEELKQQGYEIDPKYKDSAMISIGAFNMMLERFGFEKIFETAKVPGLRGRLFKIMTGVGAEVPTEFLQELNQVLSKTGATLTPKDLESMRNTYDRFAQDIVANRKQLESAVIGAAGISTVLSSVGGGAKRQITTPAEEKVEAKPAEPQAPPEPEIPQDLQEQLEKVSQEIYGKKFGEISPDEQFTIAEELTKARTAANEKKFKEAVKRAVTPEEQKAKPAKEAAQQFDAVSQEVYGKPFADITEEQKVRITEEFDKAQKAEQDRKLREVVRKTVAPKQPEVEKPEEEATAELAVEKPVEQPAAEAEVEAKPEEPAKEEKPPTAEEFKRAQTIFDKAVAKANEQRIAEQGTPKVGDKVRVKGRNKQYEVIGITESGNIRLRGPNKQTFAVKPSKIDVGVKGGQALIDLQKQFVRAELEKAGISKTIIDELAEPRRSPRPFTEEGDFRELTTRKGRIERAVEPPSQVKGKVDTIADAAVDFRNKEAEFERAKADIIEEIKVRGGEVVVDTETGAFTVKLQPGKTKLGLADTLALQKLRREAAEAGAYSLATIGRGFEIAAAPEKIVGATPLQGTFADKIKEFIRRNQAYKEAGKTFDKSKAEAHDDLVDAYLAERAAGREPQAFKGMSKAGVAVEVLTRRNRSAIEPDIEAEGRDFPKEIAQMKQEAAKRGVKGEPFLETRKASVAKTEQAKERGTYVAEQGAEYKPKSKIGDTIEVDGKKRPTRNSKGQLIHPTEQGIRNFWKWFGDSKVVDEQGRPLVVYHGTRKSFESFNTQKSDLGSHFSVDPALSSLYGGSIDGGQIFPVYLKLENPLRITDRGRFYPDDLSRVLKNLKIISDQEAQNIRSMETAIQRDGFLKLIKLKGYDGFVYLNRFEVPAISLEEKAKRFGLSNTAMYPLEVKNISDKEIKEKVPEATDSFLVFEPTQIKSAIGNRGTFSPAEPSIVKEQGAAYTPGLPKSEQSKAVFEKQDPYNAKYPKRKDASLKTNILASQAVNAIGNNRRRGRVLLANAINAEAREKGTVSLIGKEVRTSDDVAVLAQVYRDPRWETLRYIFVKNGKIVHVTGVSNRLPAATAVFPVANRKEGITWLNDLMKSTKADGYYILHNHPSGKTNPSPEDIKMTKSLLGEVNGFKGHVIIDSNNYTVLVQPGDIGKLAKTTSGELNIGYNDDNIVEIRRFRFFGEEQLLTPSTHGLANTSLGLPVRNMIDIAEVGKRFKQEKGWSVLISSSKIGVRGIMEVDENLLQDKKRAPALLRKFARQTGAPSIFAYVSDEFFHRNHPRMAKAITEGFLVDVVSESGFSAIDVLYIPNKRAEFGIRDLVGREVKEGGAIPDKITVDGKERQTRNSKGQLIHPTKEGIENFWKWFGDSKVVDEQGRPLVMYHGTTSNFDTFDTSKNSKDALYGAGFYFTNDPGIAGGEYSTREIFTYHNTEKEALSQENRVGFSWREDYGKNAGKWVARIQKPSLSAVGYVHKGKEAIKKSERDKYIVAIIEHEEFKRAMSPGYLTNAEKNRVEEILSDFENTGNLDVFEELTSQPYNISTQKIFEDAGLSTSGAVIPVFLKIDNPVNVESGLTNGVSGKLIKGVTKLWPKSNFDYIKSTFSGIVEDNETFTEKESVEDAIYEVRNEIVVSDDKNKQFTNSNFPELFQASGFDGITHTGGLRMGRQKHRVYIAFNPIQIKSATGNRGTFSQTEPSIIREDVSQYRNLLEIVSDKVQQEQMSKDDEAARKIEKCR